MELHRAEEKLVIVAKNMEHTLYHAKDEKVDGVEYGLLVQARSVAALDQDPVKILGRARPQVYLAEQPRREGVGNDSLDGLKAQGVFGKGVQAGVGGSKADVVLRDAEDNDGDTAKEEEQGSNAGRPDGEYRPERYRSKRPVSHGRTLCRSRGKATYETSSWPTRRTRQRRRPTGSKQSKRSAGAATAVKSPYTEPA